jgi:GNAT superfamily N-acetyltransferase
MNIRSATPSDIAAMDRIALDAKASWGYAAEQLQAWRSDLLTPPKSLNSHPTFVAEIDGEVRAFAQASSSSRPWELVALWVSPPYMGRGIGRALLGRVAAQAHAAGQRCLAIDSDPNAEPFYRACGARVVGSVPAAIEGQPGRTRPQLVLATRAA